MRSSFVISSLLALAACRESNPQAALDAAMTDVVVDARAPAPPSDLAAPERARIIEQIAKRFDAHYVFPEIATRAAGALRDRAARGEFDGVVSTAELARVVTAALRDVTHDLHAMLDYTPPEAESAEDAKWAAIDARNRATSGFGATTRKDGGVAVIVLDSFEDAGAARATVARRMAEIADASALVIDLRENHGGDPETVALVASHLFDARVHLNDMWWRDSGGTDSFWTTPLASKHFGGTKPVFVLTSERTFSAAEEFAYDLQCLHRAVIVGETTRGGAHPVAREKLSPLLTLRIPTGRAINPVTKTNWERTGVKPDVETDAAGALDAALARASAARSSAR